MELATLRDLYIHELKDLYSAETQLVKALPKVAKGADNADLKAGILTHLEETKEHVNRLVQILEGLGENTRGPKCKGMAGLLEEAASMLEEEADEEVRDAGIICGAQRVEHYEIAAYGCARTFAELLGETEAAELLQTTLDEEKDTDHKLSELAMSIINVAANDDDGEEEEEEKPAKKKAAPAKKKKAAKAGRK